MRIAFVNPNLAHRYDSSTPLEQPLAGSESAQCYLSTQLAKRGHEVHLLTGTAGAATVHGVHCRPLPGAFDAIGTPDAVFVTNAPEFARALRQALGQDPLIYCWEHNHWNMDQAYSSYLQNPASSRDFIVCVSEWQRNQFISMGNLDPERVFVLRNAIAPFFEDLFGEADDILACKMWPPVMAFTSTPYLGLEAAALFFQELRKRNETVTLNIFSSFDMYAPNNNNRVNPHWPEVYQKCRRVLGINYIGNVPQRFLARTLKSTIALFYPNVMPETSSICSMEAMAAGCIVITSAMGALPETSAGFGEIIDLREQNKLLAEDFVGRALRLFDRFARNERELSDRLRRQVDFVNKNYRWSMRAAEVDLWLERLRK